MFAHSVSFPHSSCVHLRLSHFICQDPYPPLFPPNGHACMNAAWKDGGEVLGNHNDYYISKLVGFHAMAAAVPCFCLLPQLWLPHIIRSYWSVKTSFQICSIFWLFWASLREEVHFIQRTGNHSKNSCQKTMKGTGNTQYMSSKLALSWINWVSEWVFNILKSLKAGRRLKI